MISKKKEAFNQLILNISMDFINLPSEQIEENMLSALAQITDIIGYDRARISLFNHDRSVSKLYLEYCAKNTLPAPLSTHTLKAADYPWWLQKMVTAEPIVADRLADLPEEAENEKKILSKMGIKSLIVIPLFHSQAPIGSITLSRFKEYLQNENPSIQSLLLVGNIFSSLFKRVETEMELRASRQKQLLLSENISDLVTFFDGAFNLEYVSASAQKLLREDPKALLKSSFFDIIHPNDRKAIQQELKKATKGDELQFTHRVMHKTKQYFWAETSICVLSEIDSRASKFVASTRDISASKAIEEENKKLLQMTLDLNTELSSQNNELSKAKGELDQFVYRISHDLRSPISSLLGLLNVSKLYDNLTEYRRLFSLMEQSSLKLDKYVSDILDYSRNSRQDLVVEQLDLQALCEQTYEQFDFNERSAVKFKLEVVQTENFFSDGNRLNIILKNLISNAIKYRRQDLNEPELIINIKTNTYGVSISISDNGIGIEDKYQDKIFNIFFRATDRISTGSGLGLYIAKEACERLKGSLSVNSALEKGTVFTLNIPNLKHLKPSFHSEKAKVKS